MAGFETIATQTTDDRRANLDFIISADRVKHRQQAMRHRRLAIVVDHIIVIHEH